MRKTYVNKNKIIYKMIIFVIAILILLFLAISLKHAVTPKYPEVDHWETYQVRSGDTLWNIVPENNNYDIRVIIDMVKEHNNINSDIYINQMIELPVW